MIQHSVYKSYRKSLFKEQSVRIIILIMDTIRPVKPTGLIFLHKVKEARNMRYLIKSFTGSSF